MKHTIPQKLQGKLWSANVAHLDSEKNKNYIIHQLLQYGSLEDIRWLFKTYTRQGVKQEFVTKPKKVYLPQTLHFIKKFILNIPRLDDAQYLKTTPRNIR